MPAQWAEKTATQLVEWLREKVVQSGCRGAVIGLSGGIDSAVTAALCRRAFGENCLGLIMPCHSNAEDERDAVMLAEHIGLAKRTVRLDAVYDLLLQTLAGNGNGNGYSNGNGAEHESLARANLKPRLRMITLYYHANQLSYLVVGTGNRSELTVGYFTKYGDGGVDLLPLGSLVKSQVRELARYLDIPDALIEKPPSAGLWQGQTDEQEMGLTYQELDQYILTGDARPETMKRIEEMRRRSLHKTVTPPVFRPESSDEGR